LTAASALQLHAPGSVQLLCTYGTANRATLPAVAACTILVLTTMPLSVAGLGSILFCDTSALHSVSLRLQTLQTLRIVPLD
jgi:hypothetical protein